jgi:hypothetical protein
MAGLDLDTNEGSAPVHRTGQSSRQAVQERRGAAISASGELFEAAPARHLLFRKSFHCISLPYELALPVWYAPAHAELDRSAGDPVYCIVR